MLEILPQSEGRFVAIKAHGELTDEDYRQLAPKLESIIESKGPIRLLIDLTEYDGTTLQAAMDDMVFALAHRQDFERIALVGDGPWEGLAAGLSDALTDAEVRRFRSADWQMAWSYIVELGGRV